MLSVIRNKVLSFDDINEINDWTEEEKENFLTAIYIPIPEHYGMGVVNIGLCAVVYTKGKAFEKSFRVLINSICSGSGLNTRTSLLFWCSRHHGSTTCNNHQSLTLIPIDNHRIIGTGQLFIILIMLIYLLIVNYMISAIHILAV